jgi:hypothetical protein
MNVALREGHLTIFRILIAAKADVNLIKESRVGKDKRRVQKCYPQILF